MKSRRNQMTGRKLVNRGAAALLILYWLALSTGTHLPQNSMPSGVGNDKLLHFAGYAGLAFLLCLTIATRRTITWRVLVVVFLVLISYGMIDELLQIPIPGRQAELGDWLADALGALAGIACFTLGLRCYQLYRRKVKQRE